MSATGNGEQAQAYRQLCESEELHRATLSSMSDAVLLTDDAGEFTFICPNADVIFGYTPSEVRALGRIQNLLGHGLFDSDALNARGEVKNIEREVTIKSGQRRTLLVHVKRVSIMGGTILYCCRDVTELKQAEEELRVTRTELAHASRLTLAGELTASIAHEMKQPLAAMVGNAGAGLSMLERVRRTVESEELREIGEILEDIVTAGQHAALSVDRLRALARKRPLMLQKLDVNEVAADALRFVGGDARRRQVSVHAELDPALPQVMADRVCLQQVLLSLFLNAMDAMDSMDAMDEGEPGGRSLLLRTRRMRDAIDIEVEDSGHGIGDAHLSKLFDPFFTTKQEGIGLGLKIAQSIVEAHHGRIWAENRAGRGAAFHVSLPVIGRG